MSRHLIDASGIWSQTDTENWLKNFPLPPDFKWPDDQKKERVVIPTYHVKKGYGFWLRTTPYFPGLFEEIHLILSLAPADFFVTPEWLAGELNKRRPAKEEQQKLF